MRPAWKPEEIEGDPDEWRVEIAELRTKVERLSDYLREKNEIIKAYAGESGMTPEDVAWALANPRQTPPKFVWKVPGTGWEPLGEPPGTLSMPPTEEG